MKMAYSNFKEEHAPKSFIFASNDLNWLPMFSFKEGHNEPQWSSVPGLRARPASLSDLALQLARQGPASAPALLGRAGASYSMESPHHSPLTLLLLTTCSASSIQEIPDLQKSHSILRALTPPPRLLGHRQRSAGALELCACSEFTKLSAGNCR